MHSALILRYLAKNLEETNWKSWFYLTNISNYGSVILVQNNFLEASIWVSSNHRLKNFSLESKESANLNHKNQFLKTDSSKSFSSLFKKTHLRAFSDASVLLNNQKTSQPSGTNVWIFFLVSKDIFSSFFLSSFSIAICFSGCKVSLGDLSSGCGFFNGCTCFDSCQGVVNGLRGIRITCHCNVSIGFCTIFCFVIFVVGFLQSTILFAPTLFHVLIGS